MLDREHRLDNIRGYSDKLTELARGYDSLRWMAENDSSDAFLQLTEAAGVLTVSSLSQLGTLLELMWQAGQKEDQP